MGLVYLPTITYIYHEFKPNVGKYTIHGIGNDLLFLFLQINYHLSHNPTGGCIFHLHDYGRKGNTTF